MARPAAVGDDRCLRIKLGNTATADGLTTYVQSWTFVTARSPHLRRPARIPPGHRYYSGSGAGLSSGLSCQCSPLSAQM